MIFFVAKGGWGRSTPPPLIAGKSAKRLFLRPPLVQIKLFIKKAILICIFDESLVSLDCFENPFPEVGTRLNYAKTLKVCLIAIMYSCGNNFSLFFNVFLKKGSGQLFV